MGDLTVVRVLDDQRRHTEVLTSGIGALLAEHKLTVRDLDRIVVDHGPGLFTGLRVGLATAQSMSLALGIGLVQVTSLEVLALDAWRRGVRGSVIAMVDARRREVFCQTFSLDTECLATSSPEVTTAQQVALQCATNGDPVALTGDGAHRFRDAFELIVNVNIDNELVPSVWSALDLGATREISPRVTALYLREADAVANFSTRRK